MSRYSLFLVVAVIFAGGVGCDNPSQEEVTDNPPLESTHMRSFGVESFHSMSPGDPGIERVANEITSIHDTVASASTWKEAHQNVQGLLDDPSPVPQSVRQEAAAQEMFKQYLKSETWSENLTEEKAEALSFYTDLLVQNRSPESDLVYVGLRNLDGHWSDRRIAAAADTTLRAAQRKYGAQGKSEDTQSLSAGDGSAPGLEAQRTRHARKISRADRKLREMLDSLEKGK